jgi:hypothetical protein
VIFSFDFVLFEVVMKVGSLGCFHHVMYKSIRWPEIVFFFYLCALYKVG